jgi:hypothetical protein
MIVFKADEAGSEHHRLEMESQWFAASEEAGK